MCKDLWNRRSAALPEWVTSPPDFPVSLVIIFTCLESSRVKWMRPIFEFLIEDVLDYELQLKRMIYITVSLRRTQPCNFKSKK
ncbi:hypothetical protein Q1695_013624 [Nippostrongylus brasiliensis]|nr:hypothetical protein Q1695_013624 [Nippostrongylus brasiliensis]